MSLYILGHTVMLDVLNLSTSYAENYLNQVSVFLLYFLQLEQWEQPHLPISSGPLGSHHQKSSSVSFFNVSRNILHRAFPCINIRASSSFEVKVNERITMINSGMC